MSYRRLPNTDKARLTVLQKLAASLNQKEGNFLKEKKEVIIEAKTAFELLVNEREQIILNRIKQNKLKAEQLAMLKLYISHFIQVLNFSIERQELNKGCRSYFGLHINNGNTPSLTTEKLVLKWAKIIVEGEQKRIKAGMKEISHPNYQKIESITKLLTKTLNELHKIEQQYKKLQQSFVKNRKVVDTLIKQLWNKIEQHFSGETNQVKKQKSALFGVVYVD
jgi:hypothetical protein